MNSSDPRLEDDRSMLCSDLQILIIFEGANLPAIAYFLGITVRMYFNDHEPPHFHVWYQGFRARVLIATGEVVDGRLPITVARVVKDWGVLRHEPLVRNWIAARTDGQLERIPGPE